VKNRGLPAVVAEFIGTFALVWTIIVVVSMYGLQGEIAPRALQFPFIAAAHVLILLLLIQTLGRVSGAHFNPAVTLSLASIREISAADAVKYVVVQLLGATAAAGLAYITLANQAGPFNYAATVVNPEIEMGTAFILEALATFFLVWTIIGVAVDKKADAPWAPLTIAGALGLGVLLIAGYTGAGLNPARSFGPALISGEWGPIDEFLLVYVLGPVLGGMLATFLFKGIFMADERPAPLSEPPEAASPVDGAVE
jgi:MIP family channel proteins